MLTILSFLIFGAACEYDKGKKEADKKANKRMASARGAFAYNDNQGRTFDIETDQRCYRTTVPNEFGGEDSVLRDYYTGQIIRNISEHARQHPDHPYFLRTKDNTRTERPLTTKERLTKGKNTQKDSLILYSCYYVFIIATLVLMEMNGAMPLSTTITIGVIGTFIWLIFIYVKRTNISKIEKRLENE